MATSDRERPDEQAFERLLLESARADHLSPGAVQNAWSRFAVLSSGFASNTSAAPHRRTVWFKGWVVGALCGSAMTATWLASQHLARPASAPVSHTQPAMLAPPPSPPFPAIVEPTLVPYAVDPNDYRSSIPLAQNVLPTESARASNHGHARATPRDFPVIVAAKRATPAARAAGANDGQTGDASTLAAEVAALDAVRAAIAAGTYLRALRLVEDYQRTFPTGQLAPDVDTLAIEALASRGDYAAAGVRAARFLERYPNTPHAARVAALVERARR